jgi:Spy/CpxP family protein refolding chaperone
VVKAAARLFLAAAAVATLAACSSATLTRLAYSNASFAYSNFGGMVAWTVDDYVDLTNAQEDWLRERLGRAMDWHRAEELPRFRRFFEDALAKSAAPFTAEDIAGKHAEIRAGYFRVMEQLVPDTAEFLGAIDTAQVAQMERKFAEENARFVRESVRGTPDERRERRVRRFINHLEAWVGPLDGEQRAIVEAHYRESRDFSEEFLGERRFRQAEMLALARARPPRAEMQAQLKRLFVEVEKWRRPEFSRAMRERDEKAFAMLAQLSGTLTPKQRAALQSRIRGFLQDIASLTTAS